MRTAACWPYPVVCHVSRGEGGLPTPLLDADHPLDADPLVMWPVLHAGKPTPPPTPVNRMTHRCKNITLPQTSFAGSKYILMY